MTAAQAEMCRLSLTTSRLGLPSTVGSPKVRLTQHLLWVGRWCIWLGCVGQCSVRWEACQSIMPPPHTSLALPHSNPLSLAFLLPQAAPAAAGPWRPSPPPAFSAEQASCDSSDCSYCQGLSQLRRSGEPGCWLRRKRSRTDLAGMAQQVEEGGGSSGGPAGGSDGGAEAGPSSKQPRVACMWDHALADPELTDVALSCQVRALEWESGCSAALKLVVGAVGGDSSGPLAQLLQASLASCP